MWVVTVWRFWSQREGKQGSSQWSSGVQWGHGACQAPRVRKAIHHLVHMRRSRGWNTGPKHKKVCVAIVIWPGSLCVAGRLHTLWTQWDSVPSDAPKGEAERATSGNVQQRNFSIHTQTCQGMGMLYLKWKKNKVWTVAFTVGFSFFKQILQTYHQHYFEQS